MEKRTHPDKTVGDYNRRIREGPESYSEFRGRIRKGPLAIMENMGRGTLIKSVTVEPERIQEEDLEKVKELVVSITPEQAREWEEEIKALKDELAAQAAMKEKEKQL